jgi:hypothetical protein
MFVYFLQQLQAINRLYHADKRGYIFYLVGLQVAYQVPFNIFWQLLLFFNHSCTCVFAKQTLAGIISLLQVSATGFVLETASSVTFDLSLVSFFKICF